MKKLILGLFLLGSVCSFTMNANCTQNHSGYSHKVVYVTTNGSPKEHQEKLNKVLEEYKNKKICQLSTSYPSAIVTEIVYLDK